MNWRLRRRFIIYKVLLIILFIYISYLFLQLTLFSNEDEPCTYEEPIDVVYTWVNGSDPKFLNDLKIYLNNTHTMHHFYMKRYDDKYELKFSLRSLEKYAPWVNHVYIVTNGQIPYWLNLDYKKVTLVTHQEIFKSSYNLPTFSSPAIECNLHRIPGLSKRFIYFNDDNFLGQPMYLEDFYTPNEGYLIYLSYPLPMCSTNCSWMFVADGQCDEVCYNVKCQLDGGDCDHVNWEKQEEDLEFTRLERKQKHALMEINYKKIKYNLLKSLKTSNNTYKIINKTDVHQKNRFMLSNNQSSVNFTTSSTIVVQKNDTFHEDTSVKNYLIDLVKNRDGESVAKIVDNHNKRIMSKNKTKKRRYVNRYRGITDTYGESLQHTHRIFNQKYGFKTRKVPSHAPLLIDKHIMESLQGVFAKEFFKTELNKIRSIDDMQFAFSYYYFLVNEKTAHSVEDIFDVFDTDGSGTWSDREIRTLLTKIYELPLSFAIVDHFETMLLNCTEKITLPEVTTPAFERYIDSRLPTISKELITKCSVISSILRERFGESHKYEYKIVSQGDSDFVSFHMLHSNISEVVTHLDDIRSRPKKFICLNDDLDYGKTDENELVKSILYDFYLSLFPKPSKFELPDDYRNKFLYMEDLVEWKSHHFNINLFIICAICILFYVTFFNTCKKLLCKYINKIFC